jgi:hypothetical protein
VLKQPIEIQTLYAELLERLVAYEALRAIGHVPGSFVLKTIKGNDYYYFQQVEPGGRKRQTYIGRRASALDAIAQRHSDGRALAAADVADIDRLCAMLRAGGAMRTDAASARVIRALGDSGVFRLGGVLVGTHAFLVLGNTLGVTWSGGGVRTQDVDIAAENTISVAVNGDGADLPDALVRLDMGFLPVPALDPTGNSTSFKVRGQGLRVDLLAPAVRAGQRDILIRRFNAWAQPLEYLDYAMEGTISAAVIDGGATWVNVPAPARFALHKLLVAEARPATMHAKRDKDLWQAAQMIEVLLAERRGDLVLAWESLVARGSGWERKARDGMRALGQGYPDIAERLRAGLELGSR